MGLLLIVLLGPPRHIAEVPIFIPVQHPDNPVGAYLYEPAVRLMLVTDWSDYWRMLRRLWNF